MKYLKQFVIGSSAFVFLPFLYTVAFNTPKKNYSYENYSLLAPIWFGLWNVISLIIAEHFGLTMKMRFLIISILSCLSIISIVNILKSYNYSNEELINYYIRIFIRYMITWNIVIYYLEKNFN